MSIVCGVTPREAIQKAVSEPLVVTSPVIQSPQSVVTPAPTSASFTHFARSCRQSARSAKHVGLSKDDGQTRVGRLAVGHGKLGPDTVQLSNAEHFPALAGDTKENTINKKS